MTWKRKHIPTGEKAAGYAVLTVLAALAVWLGATQAHFNQAVLVALSHPPGADKTAVGARQAASASQTAAFLAALQEGTAASPVEVFNPETLSDKIDGKAELYLASGFREMASRAFTVNIGKDGPGAPETLRVEVFLYAMESPEGAFAVFSGQRRAGGDPLAFAMNAYATENALFFAKDRYYAEFIADRAGPYARQALTALAQSLLASLPRESSKESAVAADSDLFPREGLRADSIQLAVSDALGMAGLENVYTAQYALPKGEAAAFLAVRESETAASAQAKAYVEFLTSMGFKETHPADAPAGVAVMAMDTMTQVVMTRGKILAGVHDAANRDAALELAGNLVKAIEKKGNDTPHD